MKNEFLIRPNSQSICFGNIDVKKFKGIEVPAGEIRLRKGQHFGPNRGFGAAHIWAEHAQEMASAGFYSVVTAYSQTNAHGTLIGTVR